MANKKLKVTVVQHSCTDDVNANRQQIRSAIIQAANQHAKLVVLPELHDTLYFCQSEKESSFDLYAGGRTKVQWQPV